MFLVGTAIALLFVGAVVTLFNRRSPGWLTATVASAVGLLGAANGLIEATPQNFRLAHALLLGSWTFQLDRLSGLFLALLFVLSLAGSWYARNYWAHERHPLAWPLWHALVATMALVLLAANALPFLMAWEAMAITSFFLVTLDDCKPAVREAGQLYLIASQAGALVLLALFLCLGQATGSLDFSRWTTNTVASGGLFLLAVIGFGLKAGIFPLHVWLPEAHPVAPSHVSALMSGLFIKLGIYGLVRSLTWIGPPEWWWGWSLMALGLVTSLAGILYALVQIDLKRFLAYSSIENIGLIVLGLGLGVHGWSQHEPALALMGFGAALWHVVHHALAKGLMFLAAGIVHHQTGTLDMERLGGLIKRLPATGSLFVAGALALSGLPPLAGFTSEFALLQTSFWGIQKADHSLAYLMSLVGTVGIAGLAVAGFTRAVGITFLGEPRQPEAVAAEEAPTAMLLPLTVLASLYLAWAVGAPAHWEALIGFLMPLFPLGELADQRLTHFPSQLASLIQVAGVLLILSAAFWLLRNHLVGRHGRQTGPTWDCGYRHPSSRMQYTASSFTQPLAVLFAALLPRRSRYHHPLEIFPQASEYHVETRDITLSDWLRPAYKGLTRGLSFFKWFQHGHLHLYVLYISLTLVGLLIWGLH